MTLAVHESVETERGCGYRKLGGLYMIGGGEMFTCHRLPFPLHVCPTCGGGIKQARGWSWIQPRALFKEDNEPRCIPPDEHVHARRLTRGRRQPSAAPHACVMCPAGGQAGTPERAGLLWVGERFYPTPEDFLHEAQTQGISKRLSQLPKDFEPGITVVYVAHPKAGPRRWWEHDSDAAFIEDDNGILYCQHCGKVNNPMCPYCVDEPWPGVFMTWRPQRIELVVETGGEKVDEVAHKRAEKLQEKFGDRFRAVRVIRDVDQQSEMFEETSP